MPHTERNIATVGLLLLVLGVLSMRHTGGKPLKVLGLTIVTVRVAVWAVSMGAVLIAFALLLADPGEG